MSSNDILTYKRAKKDFYSIEWGNQDPLDAYKFALRYASIGTTLFTYIYAIFYNTFKPDWEQSILSKKPSEKDQILHFVYQLKNN